MKPGPSRGHRGTHMGGTDVVEEVFQHDGTVTAAAAEGVGLPATAAIRVGRPPAAVHSSPRFAGRTQHRTPGEYKREY